MKITRSHILNIVVWIIIVIFMAGKSIQHTIEVHQQGVSRTMKYYRSQAFSRLGIFKDALSIDGRKLHRDTQLKKLVYQIRDEADVSNFIVLNEQLTEFYDKYGQDLNNLDDQRDTLEAIQFQMKQEALIYNAHAQSFNQLIQSFPYVYFSSQYRPFLILDKGLDQGVVIER